MHINNHVLAMVQKNKFIIFQCNHVNYAVDVCYIIINEIPQIYGFIDHPSQLCRRQYKKTEKSGKTKLKTFT